MNNSELLNKTLDLLKEIKLEHGNTDNCMSESLDQAIRNLEKIQGGDDNSKMLITALKALGKFVNDLPEIQKLLDYLAEL